MTTRLQAGARNLLFFEVLKGRKAKTMREFVEKIILETHNNVWVACSLRGCGILVIATVGKHDEDYRETRSTTLTFAYQFGLPGRREQL